MTVLPGQFGSSTAAPVSWADGSGYTAYVDVQAGVNGVNAVWPTPDDEKVPGKPATCVAGAHSVSKTVTYRDGLIAGTCDGCGERFSMPWVPGGTAAGRLMTLCEELLAEVQHGEVDPCTVAAFAQAQKDVVTDNDLIEDALALANTLRMTLGQ